MIMNPSLAPTEASIDAVDPEELKFALAFREAVFTGRTPPAGPRSGLAPTTPGSASPIRPTIVLRSPC